MKAISRTFLEPFLTGKRVDLLLLAVFLLVNGLVGINVWLHDPFVNYDTIHHVKNIEIYAQFHIPGPQDSREFFSPPLAYLPPAFFLWSGLADLDGAVKLAQILNVFLSLGVTFYILKISQLIRPAERSLKILSLAMLGIIPAYYKTFVMLRGEPYVAFFGVFAAYQALLIFGKGELKIFNILALGFSLALSIWARQWGFLLFPAIGVFGLIAAWKMKNKRFWILAALSTSMVVALLFGSWFYLRLYRKYGSITAFNREAEPTFSLANQPPEFYTGLGDGFLFRDPVRPQFPNQFFPIFYSEVWGDYWAYFLVAGKDVRSGEAIFGPDLQPAALLAEPIPEWLETNRYSINNYLARVNLASLYPTALLLLGVGLGAVVLIRFLFQREIDSHKPGLALMILVIGASYAGYAWFLINYPNLRKGDTIKATYIVYTFPFLAILAGEVLRRIKAWNGAIFNIALGLLGFVFLHNLPAMITRYITDVPWSGSSAGFILTLSSLAMLVGWVIAYWLHSRVTMQVLVRPRSPVEAADRLGASVDQMPLISLIVPARNEARNIRRCVTALLQQNYPNYELIVVDDRSTDQTPQILTEISEAVQSGQVTANASLTVLQGGDLPRGWAGKPHALVQGAAAAQGEWLCFIDADTFGEPELITSTYAEAVVHQADLFTILTDQELGSFWEKTIIPLVFTGLSFGFPADRVNDPDQPDAIANGQFVLIRRLVYQSIGGHRAVRSRIDEDKALAEVVKGSGYRLVIADGRQLARTRMYTSLPEIWEGWTKNIFLGLKDRLGLLLFGAVMGLLGALVLPLWLVAALLWFAADGGIVPALVVLEAIALWAYLLYIRVQASRAFHISPVYAFTLPLGALLFTAMMFSSTFKVLSGQGVTWRGRTYRG